MKSSTAPWRRALGTFLLLATALGSQARQIDADDFAAVVEDGMALWQVPGMAVAVIDDGRVAFMRGFGVTAADGEAVDEHTLFANASTTKAMVVAGLLILADEDRLSLDDRVIEHLPELHFYSEALTQQATIRDLLAHRTGLPSTDYWTFMQRMPLEEQIRRLRLVPPAAPPRTRLIYQNTMYELAGLIIERASGRRWDEFLAERLWQPLGMLETWGARGQIPGSRPQVQPHDIIDGTLQQVPWDLPADRADAAGSVWSSLDDMTKWAQFLLRDGITEDGRRLISRDGMQQMFEPQQLSNTEDFYPTVELTRPNWRSYGLGWFQQDFQGRKIDFHTGSLDGLIAIVGLDRANGRAVVVLGNRDHAELRHALLWEVMDQRNDDERPDWNRNVFGLYDARAAKSIEEWAETEAGRLRNTEPSLGLEAYLGLYRNDIIGDIRLVDNGEGLQLKTGRYDYTVSHWHLDTFLVDYVSWPHGSFATFTVDPDGSVRSVEFMEHVFLRRHAASE